MLKPDVSPAVKIARETYGSVIEEAKPILMEHWEELATYPDIPLDPEYELYEAMEKQGVLSIYTVRVGGALVGYAVYIIRRHLHYRPIWAINDIILVRKAYRNYGVGSALFSFIESDLRSREVSVIHTSTKLAHPELAFLLKSRGHKETELCLSLRL